MPSVVSFPNLLSSKFDQDKLRAVDQPGSARKQWSIAVVFAHSSSSLSTLRHLPLASFCSNIPGISILTGCERGWQTALSCKEIWDKTPYSITSACTATWAALYSFTGRRLYMYIRSIACWCGSVLTIDHKYWISYFLRDMCAEVNTLNQHDAIPNMEGGQMKKGGISFRSTSLLRLAIQIAITVRMHASCKAKGCFGPIASKITPNPRLLATGSIEVQLFHGNS